ncbi:MAG: 4-(cytidine 5'-diphospho)-2-C-methyl-D-erythritol kinase [Micavibrio aeruginosavorus]|uniref:4-diphosphocytidyl-2-C-methyl-D-erythritol kinase n=1 Tax=Micavibrio aeruginosavorus TaxID=349221 RepID=A0A2W5FKH4_9BACT|nr:MAG: 4-(cytidine 5'-diphospho)-2-C-methyl-D-erythritol kinase [Micavibrio aeruginosavorus]
MLHVLASAKLNLFLHVTGKRHDGYHELDSLVCFADIGDELVVESADKFQFTVDGPFAPQLANNDISENTVVKAAHLLSAATNRDLNLKITLTKNLPSGAGIGGGSADAAAILRALQNFWGVSVADETLHKISLQIGSDVPVCLQSRPAVMRGTGNIILPAPSMPELHTLLIWPRQKTPTPLVFKNRESSFSEPAVLKPSYMDAASLISNLTDYTSNDLERTATKLFPVIDEAMTMLKQDRTCLFTRMSGSGSTVFGIFESQKNLEKAAKAIRSSQPDWWVQPCILNAEKI